MTMMGCDDYLRFYVWLYNSAAGEKPTIHLRHDLQFPFILNGRPKKFCYILKQSFPRQIFNAEICFVQRNRKPLNLLARCHLMCLQE